MRRSKRRARYASGPVTWVWWNSPELLAAAMFTAGGVIVWAPLAGGAAVPLGIVAVRETREAASNRRVRRMPRGPVRVSSERLDRQPVEGGESA